MHVCMCVHTYVHTYVCMYVCTYFCMCYLNMNVCTCACVCVCVLHISKDAFILVNIDCLLDKSIESVTTIYALFGVMKHSSLIICISCYLNNSYIYHLCTDVNQHHIVRSAVAIRASLIYSFNIRPFRDEILTAIFILFSTRLLISVLFVIFKM